MPWKTFLFLIALTIVVLFATFNMHHTTDISFGFHELKDVPIFVSLFVAFLAGTVFMLPLLIFRKKDKKIPKREPEKKKETVKNDEITFRQ